MSKRQRRLSHGWHYEGDHADEKADVEEWEAQADGTFTKLLKSASVANIDQLVQLQLDRGELMDEDEDEADEDEADEDEDPDDAGVDAEEQEQEQEGEGGAEGEVVHTEEEHGGAAAATDAKGERPCKRPKVDEDEL